MKNLIFKDLNLYYKINLINMNKLDIINTIGEEIIHINELESLIKNKMSITCYDGFEPSGRMHIAQGLIRTINTNKLTQCGFKFKFWVADWFAKLNNKFGGDLKKIRKAGELMIKMWQLSGMDLENVEFIWSSDEINKNPDKYWSIVMDIACKNSLSRILRCCKIMGRDEKDDLSAAQILYPCMQCADIFYLNVDICSLGMDQRKVNMLAREYCDKVKKKFKPIIVSHHMLQGLDGSDKMSKSNPDSAIFMDDPPHEVKRKLKKAFCPPKIVEKNPILEYFKYIIFEHPNWNSSGIELVRDDKHGGNLKLDKYIQLENEYKLGNIHPGDLKPLLIKMINSLLNPIQMALESDKSLKNLLKQVKSFKITR